MKINLNNYCDKNKLGVVGRNQLREIMNKYFDEDQDIIHSNGTLLKIDIEYHFNPRLKLDKMVEEIDELKEY